jgi:hypothetical protein
LAFSPDADLLDFIFKHALQVLWSKKRHEALFPVYFMAGFAAVVG